MLSYYCYDSPPSSCDRSRLLLPLFVRRSSRLWSFRILSSLSSLFLLIKYVTGYRGPCPSGGSLLSYALVGVKTLSPLRYRNFGTCVLFRFHDDRIEDFSSLAPWVFSVRSPFCLLQSLGPNRPHKDDHGLLFLRRNACCIIALFS